MSIDERHLASTSKLRRLTTFIAAVLSVMSIVLKSIYYQVIFHIFLNVIPELIILLSTIILSIIEYINKPEILDERYISMRNLMYYKVFKYLILLVLFGYTTSIAFIDYSIATLTPPPNLFISILLAVCFFVYFFQSKKNHIYLFESTLQKTKQEYVLRICSISIKLLGFSLLFGIYGAGLTYVVTGVWSLDLLTTFSAAIMSGFIYTFWPIILSIYEWIHYHEAIQLDETGEIRLVSKTAMIFVIWISAITLSYPSVSLISTLYDRYVSSHAFIIDPVWVALQTISLYLLFISVEIIIPLTLLLVIVYHSVKRIFQSKKILMISLLTFIVYSILYELLGYGYNIYVQLSQYFQSSIHTTQLLSTILTYASLALIAFNLFFIIMLIVGHIRSWMILAIKTGFLLINRLGARFIVYHVIGISSMDIGYPIYYYITIIINIVLTIWFYADLTKQTFRRNTESSHSENIKEAIPT